MSDTETLALILLLSVGMGIAWAGIIDTWEDDE